MSARMLPYAFVKRLKAELRDSSYVICLECHDSSVIVSTIMQSIDKSSV